ncbi:stage III sporulation protein AA [Geobacillus proteiniphilus]|uniref:Stage III sporulation protein AA n=1 Tax=Geobacillus proteiniphilus TaxID=860353 RepID=A0A1Q5STG6_9BACL|nr:stage III sporulation protein AA [Geobacillus proteiniphilus]OKO91175.1 Stage III sporulation protein AA [Geobacillus proteiniphilus]WMJ17215.1 stage III sporulation protein AA [Geobacillus proteiniphilus]
MEAVWGILPKTVAAALQHHLPSCRHGIEEIRIRVSRPLEVIVDGTARLLPYEVTKEDGVHLLNKLSHYSIYAVEEELKRGFMTIEGGHRVGLAGKVVTEGGKVKAIRDVSSFNIRIAKEQIGIAEPLIPYVYDGRWRHTMIIGSPQTGKTTLLRDAARLISSGMGRIPAQKVAIVDERSEIAGCVKGIPQFSFGPRLDVLDACPKAEGMMMMIRSMSPDVMVVDEIGREEDSEAVLEAANAGVSVWTTVHGRNIQDVWQRPTLGPVMEQKVFERFIELTNIPHPGSIRRILDAGGTVLYERAVVHQ